MKVPRPTTYPELRSRSSKACNPVQCINAVDFCHPFHPFHRHFVNFATLSNRAALSLAALDELLLGGVNDLHLKET
ncbi:hypothetical protein RRG08_057442 [Elysia crispata]|uniref:Uncharacterized protein n=1 Tax=Elysia crispata TaxID=231223 RepID=A0AAE0Z3K7_9GAST|nr:hypothetical protein RRG08_057442 [Elysia crispata]